MFTLVFIFSHFFLLLLFDFVKTLYNLIFEIAAVVHICQRLAAFAVCTVLNLGNKQRIAVIFDTLQNFTPDCRNIVVQIRHAVSDTIIDIFPFINTPARLKAEICNYKRIDAFAENRQPENAGSFNTFFGVALIIAGQGNDHRFVGNLHNGVNHRADRPTVVRRAENIQPVRQLI